MKRRVAGARGTDAAAGEFRPRPFRAPWWLRGAHAQTIGGKVFRPEPPITLRRERLETDDGDFLDLDFAPDPQPGAPQVVVLHGLEGSARRRYMLLTYAALARHGLAGVGVNFRSCSGEPNRTARFYHSGETEDLAFVLRHLQRTAPERTRGAIGFSLGGNVLLKFLGERGEEARTWIGAAAAVSVPFDLAAGGRSLEKWPMGRFYTWYFMRMLRRKARAMSHTIGERCDIERAARSSTLREFDDAFTAPLHGFDGAEDYYTRSSSGRFIDAIRTPTLLLHSTDDPFLPPASIPRAAAESNPVVTTAFVENGGHVGFIGGTPHRPEFWAESEAARFLAHHLLG